jgi:hypothetical protein
MDSWLVVEPYPSEKYEFVSWDDEIPNRWKNNPNVPNHQPDSMYVMDCQVTEAVFIPFYCFFSSGSPTRDDRNATMPNFMWLKPCHVFHDPTHHRYQ